MEDAALTIHAFLTETFHSITRIEQERLSLFQGPSLSVCEMRVIDAVCLLESKGLNNATNIAQLIGITPGSLTAAVKVLVVKGYLIRMRDEQDKRRVRIEATALGRRANQHHKGFYSEMIDYLTKSLSTDDLMAIARGIKTLDGFISEK